jgi:formylglycine-generating enzyme required for sulfatase activity
MPESTSGIFISYRRESAAAFAGRLYDSLAGRLGKEHVFIDIDHIEPGEDFVEVLEKKLAHAVALIVLIGRDWLTCKDGDGSARLANPDDFVRLEIATALNRKVRVIPVLFDGARVPSSQDLPPDLTSLSRRQAVEIDHGRFHQDAAKLIDVCQKLLRTAAMDAQEKAAAERDADAERIARETKSAEERDRAEAGRRAVEQAEAERIEQEKTLAEELQREESLRLARERAETERIEREKNLAQVPRRADIERAAREKAEAERNAREGAAAEAWALIRVSQNADDFREFAEAYPNSEFASEARFLAGWRRMAVQDQGSLEPPPRINPKDGLTYVWVPPGSFTMGCSPGDNECSDDERPAHRVKITKGFWLGQTPVTQAAYQRVRGNNPSHFKGDNLPVENVTWNDAVEYCRAIGGRPSDRGRVGVCGKSGDDGSPIWRAG